MTPNDLMQEYQSKDYDYFLNQMLDRIPEDIDKREGSIIYDAVAPAAMTMAEMSLDMAEFIKQTYVKTAQDEFLDYRAVEYGTERYPATHTQVKAKFLDSSGNSINTVNIGDQFASIGETPIFYTVTKINDDLTGELTADVSGTSPNSYLGQILPVTPNDALSWAEIIEVVAPARDTETDDHLRVRLLNTNNWIAYGGNVADYLKMCSKISEIGSAQVYPVWNGPGTVKLVILNNDLMPASDTLLHNVKEIIDPEESETLGVGLAPIDHRVTVVAPEILRVNITASIVLDNQVNPNAVKEAITAALERYFKVLRQEWSSINSTLGRGYSQIIYRSKILSTIMLVDGVVNAGLPEMNGKDEDIKLIFNNEKSQLPVLGDVILDG